ncbi:G10 protein [Aureobasidium pullulans]|nr:G10 protein [Aureobasidium pullulans]
MPPIRSSRNRKPPPDGFEDIEDTLLEFSNKLKDAENASHEGKKKHEMVWPVFQITHQRSKYIYDLYYEKEAISKQLYEWLLKNNYADKNLIAKWKKQGYEKLCCLRCIQTKETNFNSTCICRVPRKQLKEDQVIQCSLRIGATPPNTSCPSHFALHNTFGYGLAHPWSSIHIRTRAAAPPHTGVLLVKKEAPLHKMERPIPPVNYTEWSWLGRFAGHH